MQLPEHLQKFPKPTLFIAADSIHAKFFLAGGDSLEELDGIEVPRERLSDHEGSSASSDGSRIGSPEADASDEPRLHQFLKQTSQRIADLVRHHGVAHVHLIMPTEIERDLTELLPNDVGTIVMKRVHLDLMKESPLVVVERVLED